jgi:hypothetical protein
MNGIKKGASVSVTEAPQFNLGSTTKVKKKVPEIRPESFTKFDLSYTKEVAENENPSEYLKYRIDLNEELPPAPIAMYIKEEGKLTPTPLFTKGNFSIITGPPKQRKTFLANMLLAEATGRKGEFFYCPTEGINIGFDTEQAKYKVQQNGKRIVKLAGTDNNLHLYSFRTLDPDERLRLIGEVLDKTENINFVVIDGIIDLGNDPILQADQAIRIVQKLMKWSEEFNIHICCVLHFNKTVATLLGHLGSFSHRKADAVISVVKDKNNENISIVEAIDTREKPFAPFEFSIDEDGLPYIIGTHEMEDKVKGKNTLSPKSVPRESHIKYFTEIFQLRSEYNYRELQQKIKDKYDEYGIRFGDSKAREFLSYAENEGIICHNGKKGVAAKYSLLTC